MRPLAAKRARVMGGAAAFCLLLAGPAAAVQAADPRSQVSPVTASGPLLPWL